MKTYGRRAHTFSLLWEFLLVILFFALSCAICIPLLVAADQKAEQLETKEAGLLVLESTAEQMRLYQGQDLTVYLATGTYQNDGSYVVTDFADPALDNCQLVLNITVTANSAGNQYSTELRLIAADGDCLITTTVASYAEADYGE